MTNLKKQFDITVIGAGPGGYPAAIKAAQMGKKVALIEAKELGGTCLNRGCIPTKTLIANAQLLSEIKRADQFGIEVKNISFSLAKMIDRKNRVVEDIRKGLSSLIKANQITLFQGYGKFSSPNEIKVIGKDNAIIQTEKTIIATGSESKKLKIFPPIDGKSVHDSDSILNLKTLPKTLVIIGGGVIGCEFASLFHALGVEVTILEMFPRIIPMESEDVSHALLKAYKKKKIDVRTSVKVQKVEVENSVVITHVEGKKPIKSDMVLLAVGRDLNTKEIGLDQAGVIVKDNGMIPVNEKMQTNVENIYAIGDIASKWWLAHVATHQGIVAAKNACGEKAIMNYHAIPAVIYTDPEIATVGMSLDIAKNAGYNAVLGAFPFQALGKSRASQHTEGFAQVVIDKQTGQILGAQVVGHDAETLIAEMALAIENELTVECICDTIHAHPTTSEAWMEACFIAQEKPLHLPPKRK